MARNKVVRFRLTADEARLLASLARETRRNKSDLLRQLLYAAEVGRPDVRVRLPAAEATGDKSAGCEDKRT